MAFEKSEGVAFPFTREEPRQTHLVTLPAMTTARGGTRLGIHTDTMGSLVKAVYHDQSVPDLSIEGRNFTKAQYETLQEHPIFELFMDYRDTRSVLGQVLSREDAVDFENVLFTPESLSKDTGHTAVYYPVAPIVEYWEQTGLTNNILPYFAGVNAFHIGSDKADKPALVEQGKKITDFIREQDREFINVQVTPEEYAAILKRNRERDATLDSLQEALTSDDPKARKEQLEALAPQENQ